jgi:hypothetical protein
MPEEHDLTDVDVSSVVLSTAKAAEFFGVSDRWIRARAAEGRYKPVRHGRYRLVEMISGWRESHQDEKAKARGTGADNRLRDARAREVEMRIAERDGRLADMDEVLALFDILSGEMVASFEGLPARLTRDVRERQRITEILDAERQRLSDRFAKVRPDPVTGLPVVSASPENDA